ncbi:B12-binding domain-containing radical SAM protein [Taibaiella sp. KBW10]|uniref:B12-binding domain-containing radical SAM protein n=1 Tax=Taibaiella sp. KBW10 TaxID=2153357 RepID=UPI000F5B8409|nr:B12-binding domain-containing radical SAM protein [Taibaiella sp. KBW10]RQO32183.1 B12-binding domain-containing radical SAM protein [Taibaiella sp. KBW10]
MPKVLLTTLNAKYIHLNLAIRILYDLNKDKGALDMHEFTIKNDPQDIAQYCADYEVVCFSCYIWNITQTITAAKAIKAISPETKILLGGPEVSYEWETVIAEDCVDYLIVGEGEIPFERFISNYPQLSFVPNLIYKEEGHIHYNKESVQFDVKQLEDRNPYQYDTAEELHNKVCYIETSRGCPYKCEFCLASLDNKVRYLPMQTIKDNLLYLMQRGRTIKFLDRTFNIKKDFTLDLFQFILDHHRPENVFQFEITADIVHPDIIAFVNEKVPKGLFRFEIGIQTVNQQSNLEVSRKQNFDKTAKVIKSLEERIEMHLDLIVGLPLEYMADLKYSFEETFKLYPPELQLGFLKFLKGTPVREKYAQYGYEFDPEPPYQIIRSNFLSEGELYQVTLLENALEIYWNKKRACHALKYIAERYSIFDCLMGLGEAFVAQHEFHHHTLKQVYEVIEAFFKQQYPGDEVLRQLLAIDYYTFYKIKPQDLYEMELDKAAQFNIIREQGLNHHKYRFCIFPVDFDATAYVQDQLLLPKEDYLIIQFDGQNKGQVLCDDLQYS